jgi:hypothetical protein
LRAFLVLTTLFVGIGSVAPRVLSRQRHRSSPFIVLR